jgi:hypothetical protein
MEDKQKDDIEQDDIEQDDIEITNAIKTLKAEFEEKIKIQEEKHQKEINDYKGIIKELINSSRGVDTKTDEEKFIDRISENIKKYV